MSEAFGPLEVTNTGGKMDIFVNATGGGPAGPGPLQVAVGAGLAELGGGLDHGAEGGEGKAIEVRLGFRPPYDVNAMLGFFARRALRGVEVAFTADGKEPSPA